MFTPGKDNKTVWRSTVIVVWVGVACDLVDFCYAVCVGMETVVVARTCLPETYDAVGTCYVSTVICCVDAVGTLAGVYDVVVAVEICGLSCEEMTLTCFSCAHNDNFTDIYTMSNIITISWHDFVSNDEVLHRSGLFDISYIICKQRLDLFDRQTSK